MEWAVRTDRRTSKGPQFPNPLFFLAERLETEAGEDCSAATGHLCVIVHPTEAAHRFGSPGLQRPCESAWASNAQNILWSSRATKSCVAQHNIATSDAHTCWTLSFATVLLSCNVDKDDTVFRHRIFAKPNPGIGSQRQAQVEADSEEPRQENRRQGKPNILSYLKNPSSFDLWTRPP